MASNRGSPSSGISHQSTFSLTIMWHFGMPGNPFVTDAASIHSRVSRDVRVNTPCAQSSRLTGIRELGVKFNDGTGSSFTDANSSDALLLNQPTHVLMAYRAHSTLVIAAIWTVVLGEAVQTSPFDVGRGENEERGKCATHGFSAIVTVAMAYCRDICNVRHLVCDSTTDA